MLKYLSFDIVFQEVPDEVTLAINISGCPNRCKGCHSPYLMEDIGEALNKEALSNLLGRYTNAITCVCFMGGDSEPGSVEQLSLFVRESSNRRLRTAWYSGKNNLPSGCSPESFDYIKLGPYVEEFGGLDSPLTNQHFYKIVDGKMKDQSEAFKKEGVSV